MVVVDVVGAAVVVDVVEVVLVVDVVEVVVVGGKQEGPYAVITKSAVPLIVAVLIHPSVE